MYNQLALRDVIKEHINWVLYLTDYNISDAARKLRMHRRSLQRYLARSKKKTRKKNSRRLRRK